MAQDIVGGLFGMTPESYQQGMNRRDTAANLTAAQLTPGQLAGYYAMQAGTGLGRAAQGLLGVEDPQMQLISRTNQLVQEIGIDTPEKLRTLASEVQKLPGGGPLAAQAVDRANKMLESAATVQAKTREQYSGFGKLIRERDSIAALNPNDPRIKDYNKAIAAEQEGKGTKIVMPAGESEFVKELAKNDAGVVKDAMKTRNDAINSLNNLNTLATLNENELISGTYASGRVGAANFLQTIGLANEKDKNRLATSEQFQKVGRDLILQTLGGKLGAGFSNEDRKFIESLIPSLENSPTARKQLIQFMQTKFTNVVDEVGRLENYARDKNSLKGYTYKTPLPTSSVAPSGVSTPSKADIEAEAAKRGIKL